MNPIERLVRRVDATQQGFGPAAVVFAVMKKFGDDNAGTLVTNLAYSAFVSVFPLLLVLVTLLSIVLAGHPAEQRSVLNSALGQFPVVGNQLGHNIHGLHRSTVIGLAVGIGGLLWGSTGLAQAGLFAMEQVWNLPGPERPNYVKRLGRSAAFVGVLAVGLAISTVLAGFGTFGRHNPVLGVVSEVLAALVDVLVVFLAFRVLTPKAVETQRLWPGAVVGGVAYMLLQAVGGYLIGHDLRNDSVAYGVFGLVLGLLAFVYLASEVVVYAAELNTVLAARLWPRGMVQPPLTEADQRSMAFQATENQRRPEQVVSVAYREPSMSQGEWLASQSPGAGSGERGDGGTGDGGA